MKTRLAVLAIGLLPLAWAWDAAHWMLPGDAGNLTWSVGYVGEYLRHHAAFPVVFNTQAYAGMAFPIYYGFIFQPLAGIASLLLGGDLTIRLIAVGAFLFQQCQVYATVLRIAGRSSVALAVTALTAFEIYPLTNFYQRGAITEFVALTFLVSAACLWLRVLIATSPTERRRNLVWAALCFTLAAGTHPIYALYGALFGSAAAIVALVMLDQRRALLGELVLAALAVGIVLAPWLYLVFLYTPTIVSVEHPIYVPGVDHPLFRLLPFPFDARLLAAPAAQVTTPHLDAQISIPLLLFALALAAGFVLAQRASLTKARLELAFAACCVAGAAGLYVLSVNAAVMAHAPAFFWGVQYVYRLAGFIDMLLFAAVCFLLLAFRRANAGLPVLAQRALWAAVGIAVISLGMKLGESAGRSDYKVPGTALFDDRSKLLDFSGVASSNYTSNKGFADEFGAAVAARVDVSFPVGMGANFGEAQPANVALDGTQWIGVTSNAIAFPWNRLSVDQRPLRADQIFAVDAPLHDNTEVLEGFVARRPVTVGLAVVPDALWSTLRAFSLAVIGLWIVAGVALAAWPRARALLR